MNVELLGITQMFGTFAALDDVSFVATQGGIHALVGENGAGKTTLMKILYGGLIPKSGEIKLDEAKVQFHNSGQAISHGIGMVSQHYSIIPELTCLQNLMLGAEPGWAISAKDCEARATNLALQMGYEFHWNDLAENLSPAGRQKLEILKLLWRDSKVMILDEPTAMLSPADSDALFASLKQLANEGRTIIVVTHRIPEVMEFCDTVTVLRGGKLVANRTVESTSTDQLAELIVGHQVTQSAAGDAIPGDLILELEKLTVKGYRGDDALSQLNLRVHSGEIVGIAGVDGNGQRELFRVIIGTLPVSSGCLTFGQENWNDKSTQKRIQHGLRVIPEDRHEEAVIDEWSLIDNGILGFQRLAPFAKGMLIDLHTASDMAVGLAARFKTKHSGTQKPIGALSGGNQQRFVAARALELCPKLILAFQPTRGLDIEATAQVYQGIRDACRNGAGAIVVSFDLDELIEQCDRVVAINHGQIFEPVQSESKDRKVLGKLMVGVS